MRRHVLEALLDSHQPLGAYEIIERLGRHAAAPAPITVYRALDFLRDNGLVHRIESRNAFVACVHQSRRATTSVVFLICEHCGAVGEAPGGAVAETLKASCASGRLHAEEPGDRDHRHLRALPRAIEGLLVARRPLDDRFRSHRSH